MDNNQSTFSETPSNSFQVESSPTQEELEKDLLQQYPFLDTTSEEQTLQTVSTTETTQSTMTTDPQYDQVQLLQQIRDAEYTQLTNSYLLLFVVFGYLLFAFWYRILKFFVR